MHLKTDSLGRHEIMDGDGWEPPVDPNSLIWSGPYQPGGRDAVDVVDPTWDEPYSGRAFARLKAFSKAEKVSRKNWQASQRSSFER